MLQLEVINNGMGAKHSDRVRCYHVLGSERTSQDHVEVWIETEASHFVRISRTNAGDTIEYVPPSTQFGMGLPVVRQGELKEMTTVQGVIAIFERIRNEIPRYDWGNCQIVTMRMEEELTMESKNPDGEWGWL